MQNVLAAGREIRASQAAARPIGRGGAMRRAGACSIFRVSATLVFAATVLPGCVSTGCESWRTRVETVRVCNEKFAQCTYEEQSVPYCGGKTGKRAAAAPAREMREPRPQSREGGETRAAERTAERTPASVAARGESRRETPASAKIARRDPPRSRRASDTPDLDRFWRSLYSASRYPGLRYGPVREVIRDPATMPASSTGVVTALKKNVNTAVSMEVDSDRNFTPMDHRLAAVVYQAHSPEAAVALYSAMVRDEWRGRKRLTRRGIRLVVVDTSDRKDQASAQRIYVQRGAYVLDVHEWKSIHADAKGKPIADKRFRHSPLVSPDAVAKAVLRSFPAK